MATTDTTEHAILSWRVSELEGLGFSSEDAVVLATSKEDNGYPLDLHKVRKALKMGCTPEQALRIYENVPVERVPTEELREN